MSAATLPAVDHRLLAIISTPEGRARIAWHRDRCDAEQSLRAFVRQAWPLIEPGQPYLHNWHIDFVAEYLMAVDAGQVRQLIINIPPRHMKSGLVTVMWPVWSWLRHPESRWQFWSYAAELMVKHSLDRRAIVESAWYQERWGERVRLANDQNRKSIFMNTRRGVMDATSSKTGKGGNRLVIDDPLNPEEAASATQRAAVLRFYDLTLSTRLDNPAEAATIVVMQRLHEDDMTGHLEEQGFTVVRVPSIAEERERLVFPVSGTVKVREEGDLLWPARFPAEVLDRAKITLGRYGFSAQHQQRPAPAEGGMLKDEWWRFYDPADKRVLAKGAARILQFWDTAHKKGEENDYSVCATWADVTRPVGDYPPGYYLLDLYRERVEFTELQTAAVGLRQGWRPRRLVIEEGASGTSLTQALTAKKLPVEGYRPDRDKIARVNAISGYVEAGFCHLPLAAADVQQVMGVRRVEEIARLPEHLRTIAAFIYEHRNFPTARHDDTVDTTSMMLLYVEVNPPEEDDVPLVVINRKTKGWGAGR